MKNPVFCLKLGLCALAVGFSGLAQAVCEIPATTNASSVQADSGNGTYNCTQHSTLKGDLQDVTHLVNVTDLGSRDPTAFWSLTPTADGKILDIRLVSVASNSGKRCNYTYSDLPTGGSGLTTTSGSSDTSSKTVTVCAVDLTGVDAPPAPPPEPISTVGNGCNASVTYTPPGETTTTKTFDVTIGYSKQFGDKGYEGAAICGSSGSTDDQRQCINECVPRTNLSNPPLQTASCGPNEDGLVQLACAPCEYGPEPTSGLNYCWHYENRVDKFEGLYFKPSPKKKSLSANIDVTTGSDCYTVTMGPMYGGRTYSYYYCPPPQ